MSLKIIALVTAKSVSKRIPCKNTTVVNGKPLYKWTTDFLEKNSDLFDVMCFSTDNPDLFKYDKNKFKTIVRPKELIGDDCPHIESVKHAVNKLSNGITYDYVMLFQPTNPIRHRWYINHAINKIKETTYADIICSYYIDNNIKYKYIKHQPLDRGYAKIKSGNFYLYKISWLYYKIFPVYNTMEIPKEYGYNINVPLDIKIVETMMKEIEYEI